MPLDDHTLETLRRRDAAYEQRKQRIRSDPRLSHEGRQRALSKLRIKELDFRRQLVDKAEQAYQDRRRWVANELGTMRNQIRANPMAALSWRDAVAHVNQITSPQQAKQLLSQAINGGDDALARAVLARAIDLYRTPLAGEQWGALLDQWAAARAQDAPLVQELRDLDRLGSDRTIAVETSSYRHPSVPSELAHISDAQQRLWANEPLPDLGDVNDLA